ncbi:hypothetical protein [Paenibacillus gansuensis]|uniref:Uncharacterized protein n=1 Tax=Paenibacillus gansuensis TaxID=306542 RepID=A0ABW5P6F3_9BACL
MNTLTFVEFEQSGDSKISIRPEKILYFSEEAEGTLLRLQNGEEVRISEAYDSVAGKLAAAYEVPKVDYWD